MIIALLLFSVIVSSHQLTPFMTIVSITALVVFQRCRARSLPILMAVLLTTWISYIAAAYMKDTLNDFIHSVLQLNNNLSANVRTNLSVASPGRVFVSVMTRILTITVWGMAVLGCTRRLRWGYWDLSCVLLAGAPFLMIMMQDYGGEIVLRTYFFSLPFVVLFAAALLYPSPASGRSWQTVAMTVLVSSTLLSAFSVAYYGNERINYFTRNEVDAVQYIYRTAPPGSLVLRGSFNTPERFQNYEYFVHSSFSQWEEFRGRNLGESDIGAIVGFMTDKHYPAAYLIITRSQKEEVSMHKVLPDGALDNLEQALRQSKRFKVIFANDDATVFILTNPREGAGQ